jgi:hypothetical protein
MHYLFPKKNAGKKFPLQQKRPIKSTRLKFFIDKPTPLFQDALYGN